MSETVTVCSPTEFPSFNDLYLSLSGLKLSFDPNIHLPTMPSPLFPNLTVPDFHLMDLSAEMLMNQLLNVIDMILGKLMGFVGAIELPTIPVLNIGLPDLLAGLNWPDLIARFRFNLPSLPSIPQLPDPLFASINMPDFEVVAKIQALIQNFIIALVAAITGLITKVINKLSLKPFSVNLPFPELPDLNLNFNALLAPLLALLAVPDLSGLLAKLKFDPKFPDLQIPSLPDLFANLSFPGFPGLNLNFPSMPNIKCPEIDLFNMLKNVFSAMCMFVMSKIMDFMKLIPTIAIPAFSLPKICVPVVVMPAAPSIIVT